MAAMTDLETLERLLGAMVEAEDDYSAASKRARRPGRRGGAPRRYEELDAAADGALAALLAAREAYGEALRERANGS
jgi:hypothetical protein